MYITHATLSEDPVVNKRLHAPPQKIYRQPAPRLPVVRRCWRLSLVSTWIFFLYSAWKLSVGSLRVAAQSTSSSSSPTYYAGCSGYVPFINDSVCDDLNNNADCGERGRRGWSLSFFCVYILFLALALVGMFVLYYYFRCFPVVELVPYHTLY